MRIAGREITGPNRVTLVLPRESGDDIVIVAEAVLDIAEVDRYIDLPKPPAIQKPTGVEYNYNDPGYKTQIEAYNTKKMAWIVLKSLEPSDIEWSTVEMDDPSTWMNFEKEMAQAGFSVIEVQRVTQAVLEANALDDAKLDEARKSFLLGRVGTASDSSGQSIQAPNS